MYDLLQNIGVSQVLPIHVIRSETVLSKLPIHNLAKKGSIQIDVKRRNCHGEVDLRWEVSASCKYGQARQLAYKLDTLIVNRRIDDYGRPVPKVLRLGSLSQICQELGLPPSGRNTNNVKNAILQNAGSLITAKLCYRGVDGSLRHLEAVFTRYSVVFTGERLPTGFTADGVYVIFNEPYAEVLNHAPVRPLNYDYLKQLPPGAQRFYEVISYRIFAALKNGHPYARLSYSDYCTYSAQRRYYEYDPFKKQMYKIQRPHIAAGYITTATYHKTTDCDGNPDWIMCYWPGPKAKSDHFTFLKQGTARGRLNDPQDHAPFDAGLSQTGEQEGAADAIVRELVNRGISEVHAAKLAAGATSHQFTFRQIAWADELIRHARPGTFRNPPGFYVYLLRENISPPETFQAAFVAGASREASGEGGDGPRASHEIRIAYEEYRLAETKNYIATAIGAGAFTNMVAIKRVETAKRYSNLPGHVINEIAVQTTEAELAKRLPLKSLADFRKTWDIGNARPEVKDATISPT